MRALSPWRVVILTTLMLAMSLTPGPLGGPRVASALEPAPTARLDRSTFAPLSPARVWDSRVGPGPTGRIGPGVTRNVVVAGMGGVPVSGATSVVLNVTAVGPSAGTFITVWPAGEARPVSSNLNVPAGDTRANLVTVKVGAGGQVSVFNHSGTVDLLADVTGWYGLAGGHAYTSLPPARVWDSRTGPGPIGRVGPGVARLVKVTGIGGVPAYGVTAVVLNLTAAGASAASYVTAWPSGEARPLTSNLNLPAGDTRPNLVVVKVSDDGGIGVYNDAGSVDLIADVAGFFSASGVGFTSVSPARVWDSRTGPGPTGRLGPSGTRSITVTGLGGVPASGVSAVVLNVTGVLASAGTHVTVWPTGQAPPLASNLNLPAGETRANLVIVRVGAGGQVSFANAAGTIDLVADVAGWYGPGPLPAPPIPDAPAGSASTLQVNPNHDGYAAGTLGLGARQTVPRWTRDFGAEVGYPLKVGGRVFATVNHSPDYGTDLYALDATTGATLWGPISLDGRYWFVGLAADSEAVYSVNYDGRLTSFSQSTGQQRWSVQLPRQYSFSSQPTVVGGVVLVGGAGGGGTLYAVNARTGGLRWTAEVRNGERSSPAVADGSAYVAYGCDVSYRFDIATGVEVWSTFFGCSGGGGRTPVLHGDSLFVRQNAAYDTPQRRLSRADGAVLGTHRSLVAPAFHGDLGFFVVPAGPEGTMTLSAIDQRTGSLVWSTIGDGQLVTAPVVIDGKVILGSSTGRVTARDEQTGAEVWSAAAGAPIKPPEEHNAFQTAALAVADGLLLVPASNTLVAFG